MSDPIPVTANGRRRSRELIPVPANGSQRPFAEPTRYDHSLMKATAEIQVVPIGVGVSVRAQVRRAQEIIRESGLIVQEHSFGTNVEGDLEAIFAVVARIHEVLHGEGTTRLSTAIKLGTRTDKEPTLAAKLR